MQSEVGGGERLAAQYSKPSLFAPPSDGADGGDGGESVALSAGQMGANIAKLGAGGHAPADIAEQGFAGRPGPLPFRAQLERSFGVPLGGVEAYSDGHAQQASEQLGAHAYASGHRIAFATPNPDIGLVAHELTHVLQHTGTGTAKKSDNAGAHGIETSGEAEAERVQAAVGAGQSAHSVLEGDRGAVGTGKGPAPALKAGQKPALSSKDIGFGMAFSPSAFEVSGSYKLWDPPPFEIPIPAVPGLNFKLAPSVTVGVSGSSDWTGKHVSKHVGVNGSLFAGLAYGLGGGVAEVNCGLNANADGGFDYTRTRGGGTSQSKSTKAHDSWALTGAIKLSTNFSVGVSLGGGILNQNFNFGQCDLGTVTGVSWKDGKFDRNKVGWKWGSKPSSFFKTIKKLIKKAKDILNLPARAAKAAWKDLGKAGGFIFNGVADVGGAIADAGVAVGGAVADGAGAVGGAVADGAGAVVDGITGLFG